MGDHPRHPSAGDEIPHMGEEAAQMQIPVKEHDAVQCHLEPETADPFPFPGDLHTERRHFTAAQFSDLPARIDVPIQCHAPAQNHEEVDIGVRGFPAAGERAEKGEPFNVAPPGLEGPR